MNAKQRVSFPILKDERVEILPRFMCKIIKHKGCWNWIGCITQKSQRGWFSVYSTPIFAYWISYWLFRGPIPLDKSVLHTCDNPICVNPKHLELGTQSKNVIDSYIRGLNPRKKLTLQQAKKLKRMYLAGDRINLGKRFGVSQETAWNIGNGRTWKRA